MATFRETISLSKEQKEAGLVEYQVQEAAGEMINAIATAGRAVSRAQSALVKAVSVPFNPARYVEAQRDLADAKDDLEAYQAAAEELGLQMDFGAAKA